MLIPGGVQVWWIPDILAAAVYALFYSVSPLYMRPYPSSSSADVGEV